MRQRRGQARKLAKSLRYAMRVAGDFSCRAKAAARVEVGGRERGQRRNLLGDDRKGGGHFKPSIYLRELHLSEANGRPDRGRPLTNVTGARNRLHRAGV